MSEQDEPASPDGDPKPLPGAVAFLGMGLSAAICVAIGLGLGLLVDHVLGTAPVFLLIGLALGVVLAALSVVRQIQTYL